MLTRRFDEGGNAGVAFIPWFDAKVRQRAAHLAFFATIGTAAKDARVCGSETSECIRTTIRATVSTGTLAHFADFHAQLCERTAGLVAVTN